MCTKYIELEFPDDGRRKATIVTDDETICKYPDAKLGVVILGDKDDS